MKSHVYTGGSHKTTFYNVDKGTKSNYCSEYAILIN